MDDTNEVMEILGAVGLMILVPFVIAMVIWQIGSTRRVKARLEHESKYRDLAETAVSTQVGMEHQLTEMSRQVTDMRERMVDLERILKDVE